MHWLASVELAGQYRLIRIVIGPTNTDQSIPSVCVCVLKVSEEPSGNVFNVAK